MGMTEKVKLPKKVCDALDLMTEFYKYPESKIVSYIVRKSFDVDLDERLLCLNEQDADAIMRALLLGYEPEVTPEEQIKNLYENHLKTSSAHHIYQVGIRDALRIHGIHYEWLEDYAE